MSLEIGLLFAVLAVMVYCFMTEILPVELTAFIGLLVMVVAGYVPIADAFEGFASPAVITMFSVFFISGALLQTGVADAMAGAIHALVGSKEVALIILVMVAAGVLSAFMNNVAATAVLLPAVSSLAKKADLSPGRLLMPLAFGAILGGTTTLVGTPPNILTSEVLESRGLEPFSLFEFAPVGLALLGAGVLFMATLGRRLLPAGEPDRRDDVFSPEKGGYRVKERLTSIRIPAGSRLDGLTLEDARLGATLDVKVVAVKRRDERHLAPPPAFRIEGGDELIVEGRYSDLRQLLEVRGLSLADARPCHLEEDATGVRGVTLRLTPGSGMLGRSLRDLRFREQFGCLVVGVRRSGQVLRRNLAEEILTGADEILALASAEQIANLKRQATFQVVGDDTAPAEHLREGLFWIEVAAESAVVGRSVEDSRIGELVGLTLVGICRDGETLLAVPAREVIRAGDSLLIAGDADRVLQLLKLGDLRLEPAGPFRDLQSEDVGVTEAVIPPRSSVAGATLRQLRFRDRFGLQVLALWRQGRAIHKGLTDLRLAFGDALLLHGRKDKIQQLAENPDFLVLSREAVAPRNPRKAPVALASLALMIALVVSGTYPIHVAAFAGAIACVLFGALTMDQAYRLIEWRALFLVAAILPVGGAMESTGAASFVADTVTAVVGPYGPHAFLAALVVLSSLLSQSLDGAPTVVIMAPVVLLSAQQLSISPYPLMMGVGLAASAAFMTPFSHKANLLVMSAGGYRAMDYVKVGSLLTVVVFAILVLLVPVFFPF